MLLDSFKQTAPKVVEDLVPNLLSMGGILKVVKNLLREGVSIRDFRTILETLADHAAVTKDPAVLTEHVRAALGRSITKRLVGSDGQLTLLTLDHKIEEAFAGGIIQTDQGPQLSVDPEFVRQFVAQLNSQAQAVIAETSQAVVLCSPLIRSQVKKLIDRFIPNIVVLSHNEISPSVAVRSFGTVRLA